MDEQPPSRSKRRQGQALNIAAQIIQRSSIDNIAISAAEIYKIVTTNKRASNKGEFSFNSENSWRKFLQMGHARSLWDRKKIVVSGYTGSVECYYYYYAHFIDDVEKMEIGNSRKWTRDDRGNYVMETEVISNKRE